METTLQQVIEQYEAQKKEMQERMRAALLLTVQSLFEKYPNLAGFIWNQYTPYFNDGDPCEFSYNEYSFVYMLNEGTRENPDVRNCSKQGCPVQVALNSVPRRDRKSAFKHIDKCTKCNDEAWIPCTLEDVLEDPNEFGVEVWQRPDGTQDALYQDMYDLNKLLGRSEDFLLAIFGDHVQVVVTRDGIETSEYEHD